MSLSFLGAGRGRRFNLASIATLLSHRYCSTALGLSPEPATSDSERELLQRQIDSTDREIDALVYELYGLTEEEIKIVEGTATLPSP